MGWTSTRATTPRISDAISDGEVGRAPTQNAVYDTLSLSAALRSIMTDETGTGSLVFGTSPTIVTPTLTSPTISDGLVSSTQPRLDWLDTDEVTANARWSLIGNAGLLNFQTRTAGGTFGETWMRARTTAGTYVDRVEINTTLQITPHANTNEKGLNIIQTTPTSGSATGPVSLNNIEAVIRSALTGTGLPGDAASATWVGMQVSVNAGGSNFDGVSVMALSAGLVQTVADTSTADKNALSSGVSIQASTLGNAYGASSAATVTATGSVAGLYGHEVNVFLYTGGVSPIRIGYHSMGWGEQRGSSMDAAFAVAIPGGGLGTTWNNGLTIGNGSTPFPLHTTANVIYAPTAGTITDVLSIANLTVSGNIITAANMTLTGSGLLLVADGAVGAPSVSFKSDTNTGMYSGTADTLRFTCGGTTQLLLNSGTANFLQSTLILSASSIPSGGSTGVGYRFSSTSNFGTFFGSGAPTLTAAKGSLYLRSDGSGTTNRAYINTDGSTTWTALTTVA